MQAAGFQGPRWARRFGFGKLAEGGGPYVHRG